MKPLLSIMIPVAPGREDRLKAILSRLTLNMRLFPEHTFEVVVVDGGDPGGTRPLCEFMARLMNLKYIYVPIKRFINAAYPRNVALRVCEGSVIGMIDIDHWPSEHIVYGMLNPFIDDAEFSVTEITQEGDKHHKIKEAYLEQPARLFGQYIEGVHNVLNRGYVIDSSKSSLGLPNEHIPRELLMDQSMGLQIHEVYQKARIPHGVNNTLWIWSAQRDPVVALNGYDEIYCRQFAYCYHPDVKALTKNGYKYIKDVEVGEEILTFNPENEQAEWQAVTQTHECEYEGELYNFKNAQCDIKVTPNHRMLAKYNDWEEIQAKDLRIPEHYQSKSYKLPLSSQQRVQDNIIRKTDFANQEFITNDLAEFLAYYVSEGHYRIDSNNMQITKDSKVNPKQHKRICELIEKFGYHPSCSNHTITICNQEFNKFVSKQCGSTSKEKRIPEIVWSMDEYAQDVFVQTLMQCDGDKEQRYATTSKQLYDDLMRLAPTLGYFISENKPKEEKDKWSKCFILKITNRDTTQIRAGHLFRVPYKGKVYCVSVPNKFLFVLSHGKTMICGNSREDDDWRERLKAQITGLKQFVPSAGFFDGQNFNFCAIHLWHPASWRGQDENNLNKIYYPKVCQPVRSIRRNEGWQWGKLLDYSLSVIGGKSREPDEHEQWIAENVPDMPNYVDSPSWSLDTYMKELEVYATRT